MLAVVGLIQSAPCSGRVRRTGRQVPDGNGHSSTGVADARGHRGSGSIVGKAQPAFRSDCRLDQDGDGRTPEPPMSTCPREEYRWSVDELACPARSANTGVPRPTTVRHPCGRRVSDVPDHNARSSLWHGQTERSRRYAANRSGTEKHAQDGSASVAALCSRADSGGKAEFGPRDAAGRKR